MLFRSGDEFLRPFPEEQKKLLQDDKFLVTVDLEPGLTPRSEERRVGKGMAGAWI